MEEYMGLVLKTYEQISGWRTFLGTKFLFLFPGVEKV